MPTRCLASLKRRRFWRRDVSQHRVNDARGKSLLLRVAQAVQFCERGCIRSSMVREFEEGGAGNGPNRVESLERET